MNRVVVLDSSVPVPEGLRRWARGLLGLEAAVELLVRSFDGRFASADWPWVRADIDGRWWLDPEAIGEHAECLSGGQRRVLAVVESLASGAALQDLPGILVGLDLAHLRLVLAAMAHAGGFHDCGDIPPRLASTWPEPANQPT